MKTIKEFDYDLWAVDVEGKKQLLTFRNYKTKEREVMRKSIRSTARYCDFPSKTVDLRTFAVKVFLMRYPLWSRQIDCGAG